MIVRNTFAALVLAAALPAHAVDYTDIWYDAAESGWGVNLVQSDAFIFGTFFVYAPNGTADVVFGRARRGTATARTRAISTRPPAPASP